MMRANMHYFHRSVFDCKDTTFLETDKIFFTANGMHES